MIRFTALSILMWGCLFMMNTTTQDIHAATFGEDAAFLEEHTDLIILKDETGQKQIAIVPEYQGRVMTSTANGDEGMSFGWINRELIASGELQKHINAFGGEDRFWMGPEGGQFSIFFKKGDPFDLDHWQTPAVIDTEPFIAVEIIDPESVLPEDLFPTDTVDENTNDENSENKLQFYHTTSITNMSGTQFDIAIHRTIRLLSDEQASDKLGVGIPDGVSSVVYESDNELINAGDKSWSKETGLLSIWILGMYNPSPSVTVVIPFVEGPEDQLGAVVNDAYFGKIPDDRLKIKDGVIYFSGDGKQRGKIGVTPQRAKPVLGSYDADNKVLTIVQYNKPEGVTDYVNSMWEMQEHPFAGDTVNSYNDGPPEPGKAPLGPFYELETSSAALELELGESIQHIHRTFHFTGSENDLNTISEKVLGVSIDTIKSIF